MGDFAYLTPAEAFKQGSWELWSGRKRTHRDGDVYLYRRRNFEAEASALRARLGRKRPFNFMAFYAEAL